MNRLKTAFSTLGCPGMAFHEVVSMARDFGYDGIEVRGVGNELYAPRAKAFASDHIARTIEQLMRRSLEIPILTTNAYLHKPDYPYQQELTDYIKLAAALELVGTKYIRVMGDTDPAPSKDIDIQLVASRLKEMGAIADDHGLTLLIETNGVFAKSSTMQSLISESGQTGIGVLWDVHHPYRYFGEPVSATYAALKPLICHVHIKDSAVVDGTVAYKLAGEGDVPLADVMDLLTSDGYNGYVSLEWVKRWCKDLEEPGIAFVQYIHYINR